MRHFHDNTYEAIQLYLSIHHDGDVLLGALDFHFSSPYPSRYIKKLTKQSPEIPFGCLLPSHVTRSKLCARSSSWGSSRMTCFFPTARRARSLKPGRLSADSSVSSSIHKPQSSISPNQQTNNMFQSSLACA